MKTRITGDLVQARTNAVLGVLANRAATYEELLADPAVIASKLGANNLRDKLYHMQEKRLVVKNGKHSAALLTKDGGEGDRAVVGAKRTAAILAVLHNSDRALTTK